MKKSIFTLAFVLMFGCLSFANGGKKNLIEKIDFSQFTENKTNNVLGRQCCTKSIPGPNGSVISMTACAGSFLVNDATAMANACAKVDKALSASTNP